MPPLRPRPSPGAFTLVELLVSMAILTLLVVAVAQMVSSAAKVTTASRRSLNADRTARLVFDRMAEDFAQIVRRRDVDTLLVKRSGNGGGANDTMIFYSVAPGAYAGNANKSPYALVGYQVNDKYQLTRLGKSLAWDPSGGSGDSMSLSLPSPSSPNSIANHWPAAVDGTDSDYRVLSDAVFRVEFTFEVSDRTEFASTGLSHSNYPVAFYNLTTASNPPLTVPNKSTTTGSAPPSGPKAGDRWYDSANSRAFVAAPGLSGTGANVVWKPLGLDDVQAVVVTLAILEPDAARPVQAQGVLPQAVGNGLVAALPDPLEADLAMPSPRPSSGGPPILAAQTWATKLPGLPDKVGIPPSVAAQVHVYQRFFHLNNP